MILIALTISIYFAAFFQIKIFIGSISTYRWHFRIRDFGRMGNGGAYPICTDRKFGLLLHGKFIK